MVAATQNINNSTLKSVLQSEKLTGPNFMNWHRNLRIVLRSENKMVHLEQPLIPLPLPAASQAACDAYDALFDAQNEVAYLMLGSMSPDLQRALENYKAFKAFHACKQEDGQSVIPYLLKMKGYLDTLERLGYPMPNLDLEGQKETVRGKGKDKGKNKLAYAPKPKIPSPPKRENPEKDSICHHCKEGLKKSRKLKHGALSLYVGNVMHAAVEAIGSFDLVLPSGLIIV
ncbi:hypothetical protein Tco_0409887 [Tanacetum coccineum]